MEKLKDLYLIQQALKDQGYFDISRISQEVYSYATTHNVPIQQIILEIQTGKPWEYICGEADFRTLKFDVNSSTLIPRIETEVLVDIAKQELSQNEYTNVIDVGTGSGCVIISLAKESSKEFNYYATDISQDALDTAVHNEERILKKKIINFTNTNLIEKLTLPLRTQNLILANLPYIPTSMYENLNKSVKAFEPRNALDGGMDGIKYYKSLLDQIKEKKILGKLIFEIEPSTLSSLLYLKPKIIKDQFGYDRFLVVRFG